ncbi:hypothetical protein PO073_09280 [Bacteroides thetaiotaomicron]|jgi:hypothetical protein|uniref:hypothetical protein n=1 Tax=Bacteroides thetaiotaomicron TaxID=818 RepID=UPI0018A06984|nr:hypothetical protein [Bacteroides thetaiotaomicron]MDC2172613.1 hypothetical protein [Bacteroides thetaiotaomicron]MDC2187841.1 hypothetical protein [Bacteroides thetaiotaomicron]
MVIYCPGAIDDNFHCDKLKYDNDISFNLFIQSFVDSLSCSSKDGTIKCAIPQYDAEINDILNLHHSLLKEKRRATLMGLFSNYERVVIGNQPK